MRILVVDNYDSFVFNLVQYLGQLGAECVVVRNDEVTPNEADKYDGVLISPGPGVPEEAGVSMEMIRYCAEKKIPLFGVCLGHQAIASVFGELFQEHQSYYMEKHLKFTTINMVCLWIFLRHLLQPDITHWLSKKIQYQKF